jgi:hypothetical protein
MKKRIGYIALVTLILIVSWAFYATYLLVRP